MATPETITGPSGKQLTESESAHKGINSDYKEKFDFDDIHYFVRASERPERSWDDVPEDIKNTFDRLGIPEAERKFLSGVGAQYESEVVYHQVNEKLEEQGVIFTDMD